MFAHWMGDQVFDKQKLDSLSKENKNMSWNCPKCGGPNGVLLFTTVSPCDKCVNSKTNHPTMGAGFFGFKDLIMIPTKKRLRVAIFYCNVSIVVPNDATFGAWISQSHLDLEILPEPEFRKILNELAFADRLRNGKSINMIDYQYRSYW